MLLKRLAVLFGFVSLSSSVFAQQPSSQSPPVRDPQAITVVQSAIAAVGGPSAAAAIQDFSVQGTERYVTDPDPNPATFSWQNSGAEFSYTVQNSNGTYTALSGHGIPAQLKHGNWIPLPPYVARAELAFHNPIFVLYAELQNQNYSFQYVGVGTVEGNAAIHIHAADNSDSIGQLVTPQEWYFDPATFLPMRVEFKAPDERNAQGSTPVSEEFSNYQTASGFVIPYQIKIQIGPQLLMANISSATVNSGLPASTFDPPTTEAQ